MDATKPPKIEYIRVSTASKTSKVAGAIAGIIRERDYIDVQAIGAGAVNVAVKAITTATIFMAEENVRLITSMQFVELVIDDRSCTAIRFSVQAVR